MFRNAIAVAAASLLVAVQPATAALTTHVTESAFTSAVTGVVVESFESFDSNESAPLAVFSAAGTLDGLDKVMNASQNGRHATDGAKYWYGGGGANTAVSFEITFAAGIQAFGFWGTDIGDFSFDCSSPTAGCNNSAGSLKIEFFKLSTDVDAAFIDTVTGADSNANELFRGYSDSSGAKYQRVRITNLQSAWDGHGFDELMIGDVQVVVVDPPTGTPEPGVLALIGLGFLGLFATRRR